MSLGGPWGSLWVPGVPGVPSVRDPFEAPSKLRENMFFFHNLFENHFLLLCRAINPIIVKGWLNFGALVGYHLCGIVFCTFLIHILIRKHVLCFDGNFPEIWHIRFLFFKFPLMSFIFPLMAFNFPHSSSYFLNTTSYFLEVSSWFLEFSLQFLNFPFNPIDFPLISFNFPLISFNFPLMSFTFYFIPFIFYIFIFWGIWIL